MGQATGPCKDGLRAVLSRLPAYFGPKKPNGRRRILLSSRERVAMLAAMATTPKSTLPTANPPPAQPCRPRFRPFRARVRKGIFPTKIIRRLFQFLPWRSLVGSGLKANFPPTERTTIQNAPQAIVTQQAISIGQ